MMHLYKGSFNGKYIDVYNFVPNKKLLKQFKEDYRDYIKTVSLFLTNDSVKRYFYDGSVVLTKPEDSRDFVNKSYILEVKNDKLIQEYIDGKYDSKRLVDVIGPYTTVPYDLSNSILVDGTLLSNKIEFKDGTFQTVDSIMLFDELDKYQQFLQNDVDKINYLDLYSLEDDVAKRFFSMFDIKSLYSIDYEILKKAEEEGIVFTSDFLDEKFEKSEKIMTLTKEAKKKK